jgi:hypothetical protein
MKMGALALFSMRCTPRRPGKKEIKIPRSALKKN